MTKKAKLEDSIKTIKPFFTPERIAIITAKYWYDICQVYWDKPWCQRGAFGGGWYY